jgi:hypothetical protein
MTEMAERALFGAVERVFRLSSIEASCVGSSVLQHRDHDGPGIDPIERSIFGRRKDQHEHWSSRTGVVRSS